MGTLDIVVLAACLVGTTFFGCSFFFRKACFLIMQSARSGIILLLLAILINQLLGCSYEAIIVVTGVATMLYSMMGGFAAVADTLVAGATEKNRFEALAYNRAGTCDLKGGLFSWPMVFDSNGVPDLLVGAEDGFFYLLRSPLRSPE